MCVTSSMHACSESCPMVNETRKKRRRQTKHVSGILRSLPPPRTTKPSTRAAPKESTTAVFTGQATPQHHQHLNTISTTTSSSKALARTDSPGA